MWHTVTEALRRWIILVAGVILLLGGLVAGHLIPAGQCDTENPDSIDRSFAVPSLNARPHTTWRRSSLLRASHART